MSVSHVDDRATAETHGCPQMIMTQDRRGFRSGSAREGRNEIAASPKRNCARSPLTHFARPEGMSGNPGLRHPCGMISQSALRNESPFTFLVFDRNCERRKQ